MKRRASLTDDAIDLLVAADLQGQAVEETVLPPKIESFVDGLHDEQRRAWHCDDPERYLLCSRRSGKTWWAGAWLFAGALEQPRTLCAYLALTGKSAHRMMWPVLVELALQHRIPMTDLHEGSLTVGPLPNGSTIVLGGTDDRRNIETIRGWQNIRRAVVDECGAQPEELLAYTIDDILIPALSDNGGLFAGLGTPGRVCTGTWFERTGPMSTYGAPVFHWDVRANPYFRADVHALLEREARKRGGWDSPSFRREWLGEWAEDPGVLVFPIIRGRNTIDRLPTMNRRGMMLEQNLWRYGIGVDVGYTEATAVTVVAVHPYDEREFVLSSRAYHQMLPRQLRDVLRELQRTYHNPPIVLDAGGMGKVHAEELARDWGIYVEPARKTDKDAAVREGRDSILAGRTVLLDGEPCDALRVECARGGWNKDKTGVQGDDHQIDSWLYIRRRMNHHVDDALLTPPKYPLAWADAVMADELERARRRDSAAAARVMREVRALQRANARTPWLTATRH